VRATLYDLDHTQPLPSGMMIIGARQGISDELTFEQVQREVTELVDRIRRAAAPGRSE
jgi:hypothetical protein